MGRALDADEIMATLTAIGHRIGAEFPSSDLVQSHADLMQLTRQTRANVANVRRTPWFIRLAFIVAVIVLLILLSLLGKIILGVRATDELSDLMQGLDSAIVTGNVFTSGIAVYILSLDTQLRRKRGLVALNEIRDTAHAIDMQEIVQSSNRAANSKFSGNASYANFDACGYLDCCSDMLSICGKLAALYSQAMHDNFIVDTVANIERLTAELSHKMWRRTASSAQGPRIDQEPAGAALQPMAAT
jgi:hypothetical protein